MEILKKNTVVFSARINGAEVSSTKHLYQVPRLNEHVYIDAIFDGAVPPGTELRVIWVSQRLAPDDTWQVTVRFNSYRDDNDAESLKAERERRLITFVFYVFLVLFIAVFAWGLYDLIDLLF